MDNDKLGTVNVNDEQWWTSQLLGFFEHSPPEARRGIIQQLTELQSGNIERMCLTVEGKSIVPVSNTLVSGYANQQSSYT